MNNIHYLNGDPVEDMSDLVMGDAVILTFFEKPKIAILIRYSANWRTLFIDTDTVFEYGNISGVWQTHGRYIEKLLISTI